MSDAGIRNLERIQDLEHRLAMAKDALEYYADPNSYDRRECENTGMAQFTLDLLSTKLAPLPINTHPAAPSII